MFRVREIKYRGKMKPDRLTCPCYVYGCVFRALIVFYLPFYEFALSDESLLLCANAQQHYYIVFLGDIISSKFATKFGHFLRRNLINFNDDDVVAFCIYRMDKITLYTIIK